MKNVAGLVVGDRIRFKYDGLVFPRVGVGRITSIRDCLRIVDVQHYDPTMGTTVRRRVPSENIIGTAW